MKTLLSLFFASIFFISVNGAFGQEYDDLYFTRKDRKKVLEPEEEKAYEPTFNVPGTGYSGNLTGEQERGTSGVSPELVEKYRESGRNRLEQEIEEEAYENANYSDPRETYYNDPVVVNNYYGPNANRWNNRWRFGFGWNNWGSNFFGASFGNPWCDPFFGNNIWYDPWIGNGFASPWGGYYDPFYQPFYGSRRFWGGFNRPYYVQPVVVGNNVAVERRRSVRGSRATRGSVSSAGRASRRSSQRVSDSRSGNVSQAVAGQRSRSTVSRSGGQPNGFVRSRTAVTNSSESNGASSTSTRVTTRTRRSSSAARNSGTRSSVSRTSSQRTAPARTNTRTYNTRSSSAVRKSSSGGTVRRSSSSRSTRSYSTPSRSTPSRSSGRSSSSSSRTSSRARR